MGKVDCNLYLSNPIYIQWKRNKTKKKFHWNIETIETNLPVDMNNHHWSDYKWRHFRIYIHSHNLVHNDDSDSLINQPKKKCFQFLKIEKKSIKLTFITSFTTPTNAIIDRL